MNKEFWLTWNDIEGIERYEPLWATCKDFSDYFSNYELEIIGNIPENSELLTKKQ